MSVAKSDMMSVASVAGVLQARDRALLDQPTAFIHHERVLDLTGVDHASGQLHPVDEPQAGVRKVEVRTGRRQIERIDQTKPLTTVRDALGTRMCR